MRISNRYDCAQYVKFKFGGLLNLGHKETGKGF
mgnify:CR=1 FL=1